VAVALLATADVCATETGDLSLVPGPDGFLASWLVAGPIVAPKAHRSSLDALGEWDPWPAAAADRIPAHGVRVVGGSRWRAAGGRPASLKLKTKARGTVTYLAAVLRTDQARRVWLSTGSDGGLAVTLDGREIHRSSVDRRAAKDTDLIALDLEAGDNTLVLRAWTRRTGTVRVFARLMDRQHRRPSGLEVVLPGAAGERRRLLKANATLSIEREIDPVESRVRVLVWLDFHGGRPVGEPVTARIAFEGPQAPAASEKVLDLGPEGAAFELLAETVLDGKRCPDVVRVSLGKVALRAHVGVRMRDVRALADAFTDRGRIDEHADLPRTSVETLEWRLDHLRSLIEQGDRDYRYIGREARKTARIARELARGRDPFADRRGEIQRRGYRSSVDGRLHHYALYVPPRWREKGDTRFGLVVALHGLNGLPVKTLQSLFGIPMKEGESKVHRARHPDPVEPAPMFALAPEGFGNSGYRAYGERDVLEVIDRVRERYRIDPDRIYVTGASMGGTGAASVPLHHPGAFAAAAPLCGYHSLANYASLAKVELHPWERFLASFRSNTDWAGNGRHLPLYVVHGTKDNPRHSASLVERYELWRYDVTYETPEAGHNVWDETYRDRRIFTHFQRYRRKAHPRRLRLHTARLRYNRANWLTVVDADDYAAWSKVDGLWDKNGRVELTTENVAALAVDRDAVLARGLDRPPVITIDGRAVEVGEAIDGAWRLVKRDGSWISGKPACSGLCKRPGLAGPIDDAFYEPLLFVYGTADPDETALSRRLIERIRRRSWGATVDWPVEADVEVSEHDIADRSLVIVGTPQGNGLLRRIADRLPIRVKGAAIVAGDRRFEGDHAAAVFVHPNPLNPKRYVLVYTAVSARGLFHVGHLPGLLPDWIVFDGSSWGRIGGLALGQRRVHAAGFFDRAWRIVE
jgi:poly(3-hydroxybutyrate) depolymerase